MTKFASELPESYDPKVLLAPLMLPHHRTGALMGEPSYRVIGSWAKKGMLLGEFREGEEENRRHSAAGIIWIKMLDQARALGLEALDVAKALIKHYASAYQEIEVPLYEAVEDEEGLKLIDLRRKGRSDAEVDQLIAHQAFAHSIAIGIAERNPFTVRLFYDKTVDEVFMYPHQIGIQELMDRDYRNGFKPHVALSPSLAIWESMEGVEFKKGDLPRFLSGNERELVNHLNRDEVSEINITMSEGKVERFLVTEKFTAVDMRRRAFEYMSEPYQEITFKTNGDKKANFTRTTSFKPKK